MDPTQPSPHRRPAAFGRATSTRYAQRWRGRRRHRRPRQPPL